MAKLEFEVSESLEKELETLFKNSAKKMLHELATQEKQSKEFMNLNESANYIGCSINTLKMWINKYNLKIIRVGGKKMIHRETLIDFLKSFEG